MKKLYESDYVVIEDEESKISEKIHVYKFNNEIEAEDYDILSSKEKLLELGFREESTPEKDHAKLHRYYVDNSDCFLVIKESVIEY